MGHSYEWADNQNDASFWPRCFNFRPVRRLTRRDDGVTLRSIRFIQASASLALLAAQDGPQNLGEPRPGHLYHSMEGQFGGGGHRCHMITVVPWSEFKI